MQWDEASRQHTVLEEVEERALSSALTNALAAVYKRGSHASGISWPRAFAWALVGSLVLPVVTMTPYFLVPLGRASEQLTFASQWRYYLVVLPLGAFTVYSACTFVLLANMNVPATRHLVVGCSCIFCLVYLSIEWAVSQLWAFPVPMGYVWIVIFGSATSTLWLVHEVHGLRHVIHDRALLLNVSCQLGLSVLVIMFLVAFAIYRSIFASLDGGMQVAIAPLFSAMKLAFKEAAVYVISIGGNPNAGIASAFAFDVICGTTANFLVRDRRPNSRA